MKLEDLEALWSAMPDAIDKGDGETIDRYERALHLLAPTLIKTARQCKLWALRPCEDSPNCEDGRLCLTCRACALLAELEKS